MAESTSVTGSDTHIPTDPPGPAYRPGQRRCAVHLGQSDHSDGRHSAKHTLATSGQSLAPERRDAEGSPMAETARGLTPTQLFKFDAYR